MRNHLGSVLGTAVIALGSAGVAVSEPAPPDAGAPPTGEAFVQAVARYGADEIAAARYVLRASKSVPVTSFAQRMIADHATANVQLQTAARTAGVRPPAATREAPVPPDLGGLAEPQLDRAYMRDQARGHARTLAIVRGEIAADSAPALVAYATMLEPIVRSHLDAAQNYLAAQPEPAAEGQATSGSQRVTTGARSQGSLRPTDADPPSAGPTDLPASAPPAGAAPSAVPSIGIPALPGRPGNGLRPPSGSATTAGAPEPGPKSS